jgi:hypothetical protein
MKDMPALTRLCELEEIAACLVFTREGKILGRAVPSTYSETMLHQVILVLKQVIAAVEKTKIPMREARFVFESYGLWIKVFGGNHILAIFLQPGITANLLRQPVNLAVVNLEKAVSRMEDEGPVSEAAIQLASAAHEAELAMLQVDGQDSNEVFERLVVQAEYFFGPVAVEILEHGLRAKQLALPLKEGTQIRELVRFCSESLDQAEVKKIYLSMADDLIECLELELQSRKNPQKK